MDLEQLPPDIRAWALVGRFLQQFAATETAITEAIGRLVGLDQVQFALLLEHLAFARKVEVLRTLIKIGVTDEPARSKLLDALNTVFSINGRTRVLLAHLHFGPGAKDLEVYSFATRKTVRASWTIEEMNRETGRLFHAQRQLNSLIERAMLEKTVKLFEQFFKSEHNLDAVFDRVEAALDDDTK